MLSFDKEYRRWTIGRIMRHVLYWGFWLTFYCTVNGSYYDNGYLNWLLLELYIMAVKIPFAYFVAYFLVPRLLPKKRYVELGISVILLALGAAYFIMLINNNVPESFGQTKTVYLSGKTFYRGLDLIYVTSLVVIIKLVQEYYRQKKTNAQLIEEKVNAELQILKNQLQPHFLFNTLNNIYSLVISNDKKAAGALLKLSDILSYMLYDCNVEKVSLEKEIDLINNYIKLEKLRYGDRLDLSFEVSGNAHGKSIAPLLLIPFIENAFKHGAAKSQHMAWIRINLNVVEDELTFLVENNCPDNFEESSSELKSGIGLENVRKRLELLYPENHKLISREGDSFLINLKVNL